MNPSGLQMCRFSAASQHASARLPRCRTQSISSTLTATVLTGAARSWGLMSPNSAPKISIIIPPLQEQTRSLLSALWLTEPHNMRPLMCYTQKSPCRRKINVPALMVDRLYSIYFNRLMLHRNVKLYFINYLYGMYISKMKKNIIFQFQQ